jgi:DNA polymerase-3 subunit beta
MKLVILKEKLKKGIQIAERASSKSVTLPVLQNIFLSAERNFLNLFCTDLEIAVKWWGLAKIEREGKILLPIKTFSDFINFLPEKPVLIEKRENFVLIESEPFSSKMKFFNPEEFPIFPKLETEKFFEILPENLIAGIRKVISFSSPSTTRPEISGICLNFGKNFLKIVATDSFRLGEATIFLPEKISFEKETSIILPQKAAREIINIFGNVEKNLKVYLNPNQLAIESEMEETSHPEVLFASRLIEGEFPDYQAIIPKKFSLETRFQKEDFLKQIKAASVFSPKNNEIKFKFEPEKKEVKIMSENPELGSYSSALKGEMKGKEITIAFNYRFLLEGIEKIEGKEFFFKITSEEGPALIEPFEKEDFLYILMPIKTL